MDNFPRLRKLSSSSVRVFLFITVIVRIALTSILLNKYIVFASVKEVKKGGTFVEAIYEPISYLPYRGDPNKNFFYQTMLFPGCNGGGSGNLCTIATTDDKTYTVSVNSGSLWSDEHPLTSDDVLFTYKDIVINNKREQTYLAQYKDIVISTGENDTIIVTFPIKTSQNKSFFSLPLLPKHIVESLDIDSYVKEFSSKPITVGCARLTTSNDNNSLVIDLSYCKYSNINYYQIKSYPSYEAFLETSQGASKNAVSFYQGPDQLSGYSLLPIINNTYMSLFFNTSSENLSSRIQRALGGLLYNDIIKNNNTDNMIPYTGLFAHHQSDGTNIEEFISSKNPKLSYDKQGLEQAGVKALPETITIDTSKPNTRQSYFFSKTDNNTRKLGLSTVDAVYAIKGRADRSNTSISIKSSSDRKSHTINFSVGANKQIREGVNTLIIEGDINGQKKTLVTLDLYYLGDSTSESISDKKLKIIYYNDKISQDIISTIQDSFKKAKIDRFFELQEFDDINLFAAAINTKEYDMVLTPLSMTSPVDIAAIITNQDTQKNPSSYQNLELAKLLEKYSRSESSSDRKAIVDIFSTDMPFVILGQVTTPYRIKSDITLYRTGQIQLKDLRSLILSQANIVSHMNIRGGKLLEKETLKNFIESQHSL